jgi:hypothetical protein
MDRPLAKRLNELRVIVNDERAAPGAGGTATLRPSSTEDIDHML